MFADYWNNRSKCLLGMDCVTGALCATFVVCEADVTVILILQLAVWSHRKLIAFPRLYEKGQTSAWGELVLGPSS